MRLMKNHRQFSTFIVVVLLVATVLDWTVGFLCFLFFSCAYVFRYEWLLARLYHHCFWWFFLLRFSNMFFLLCDFIYILLVSPFFYALAFWLFKFVWIMMGTQTMICCVAIVLSWRGEKGKTRKMGYNYNGTAEKVIGFDIKHSNGRPEKKVFSNGIWTLFVKYFDTFMRKTWWNEIREEVKMKESGYKRA